MKANVTPPGRQGAGIHVMHFLERRQGAKSAKFAKRFFVGSARRTALFDSHPQP
jgi:hypothetical protein